MANFSVAAAILLDLEGGFAASDVGNGAVNRGITADFLRRIGEPFDEISIRSMTDGYALDIYHKYFWTPIHGERIRDQVMANLLLATALHTGVVRAIRFLQEVAEVKADGIMGPNTEAAVSAVDPADFAMRIWAYYRSLAKANPNLYLKYLEGWQGRLEKLVPDLLVPKEGTE